MGIYVANQIIKLMIKKGQTIDSSRTLILGITFKENCPDIRNSRVIDVIEELQEFGTKIDVYDPWADSDEVKREYGIELINEINLKQYDSIILAVAHNEFKKIDMKKTDKQVLFDIKSFYDDSISDGRL
jgi:UDP-N-acetyl-D-galactosamine dehydrogenase